MKSKSILFFYLVGMISTVSIAQLKEYHYSRTINGISGEWHSMSLPDELFVRVQADLNDIRIIGITNSGDTIEAPYLVRHLKNKTMKNEVLFERINDSKRNENYYFTFKVPIQQIINNVDLEFGEDNFDRRIKLEGSQDQREWFDILNEYRILSIKNSETDYSFTKLKFLPANYAFFRLQITSESKPKLINAFISHSKMEEGNKNNCKVKLQEINENEELTILDITMEQKVPLSQLKINVMSDYDYYRPVHIQFLADSFQTENGWKYQYRTLKHGTLSSLENNEFTFDNTITNQLKVVVNNRDNEPLNYGVCTAWGYKYVLVARFTEKARYSLFYGNPAATKPEYDISHFSDYIPELLTEVGLGSEQKIISKVSDEKNPLLENKVWLWAVLVLIVAVLGYYSIKMINSKNN